MSATNLTYLLLSMLLAILCQGCMQIKPELGLAQEYFPSAELLQEGIVNKYYVKTIPNNPDKWTYMNMTYSSMRLLDKNKMELILYNSAMEKEYYRIYSFEDDKMFLEKETGWFHLDSCITEIKRPNVINWVEPQDSFKILRAFSSGRAIDIVRSQESIQDTIVENYPSKMFNQQLEYDWIFEGDSAHYSFDTKLIYGKGLGMVESITKGETNTRHLQLVEQIPWSKFSKMKDHGTKRVAYIDPTKTIDDHGNFKLCDKEKYIVDYYNGDPDAGIIGGKPVVWNLLEKHLDESKIEGQSGYLTFRFVINCNGEAGRFMAEETDLDFKQCKFSQSAKDHLYQILRKIEKYQATKLEYKENVDAYFYLTFKMKDGKIIELLP